MFELFTLGREGGSAINQGSKYLQISRMLMGKLRVWPQTPLFKSSVGQEGVEFHQGLGCAI